MLATGRDQARLADLAAPAGSVAVYAGDLSQPGRPADECVAAAVAAFGLLDGLVHAAGGIRRQEDLPRDDRTSSGPGMMSRRTWTRPSRLALGGACA